MSSRLVHKQGFDGSYDREQAIRDAITEATELCVSEGFEVVGEPESVEIIEQYTVRVVLNRREVFVRDPEPEIRRAG